MPSNSNYGKTFIGQRNNRTAILLDPNDVNSNAEFSIMKHSSDYFGGAEHMFFINKNSNVGIGTTSPSEKLDVNGNVKIYGSDFKL